MKKSIIYIQVLIMLIILLCVSTSSVVSTNAEKRNAVTKEVCKVASKSGEC